MVLRNLKGKPPRPSITAQQIRNRVKATTEQARGLTTLAPSSAKNMQRIVSYWEQFCKEAGEDPKELLIRSPPPFIEAFFHWYCGNGRVKSASTLDTYWHQLNEQGNLYRGDRLLPQQIREIKKVLSITIKDHCLQKKTAEKSVMEFEDLSLALQYYWTKDEGGPPTGRDRVQLAALLLLIAYTGSRPDAMLNVQYSDVSIYKYRAPGEPEQMLMEVQLRHLKNSKNQPKSFMFGIDERPMFCVISHVIALALDDRAFALSSLSSNDIFGAGVHSNRERQPIPFTECIQGKYLFRASNDPNGDRRQTYDTFNRYTQKLGAATGFPRRITAYSLRRGLGNAVNDDPRANSATRNLVMDHNSQTVFERNYISRQIRYDTQGAFMKAPSRENLFRAASRLSSMVDTRRPTELPLEEAREVDNDPAIRTLCAQRDDLGHSDGKQRERLKTAIAAERRKVKAKLLRACQARYDREAPILDLEKQRAGEPEIPIPIKTVQYEHPEQVRISELVTAANGEQTCPEFTDMLAKLCKRSDKCRALTDRRNSLELMPQARPTVKPTICKDQCLFCLFDPSMKTEQRQKAYRGPGNISRHVLQKHMKEYEEGEVVCPDPACGGILLRSRHLLQRHAHIIHGLALPEKQRQRQKQQQKRKEAHR